MKRLQDTHNFSFYLNCGEVTWVDRTVCLFEVNAGVGQKKGKNNHSERLKGQTSHMHDLARSPMVRICLVNGVRSSQE